MIEYGSAPVLLFLFLGLADAVCLFVREFILGFVVLHINDFGMLCNCLNSITSAWSLTSPGTRYIVCLTI